MSELLEQAKKSLDFTITFTDAPHLRGFLPEFRVDDPQYRYFKTVKELDATPDMLSFSTPEAISAYYGSLNEARAEGMWLRPFVQGVASLGIFLLPNEADRLGELTSNMINAIEEHERYPALVSDYADHYATGLLATISNGEITTRERLLAYNYGLWWGMGHLEGIDDTKILGESRPIIGRKKIKAIDWIRDVLKARLERGFLEEL